MERGAVIGLGAMGSGIATALAEAGLEVTDLEADPVALARDMEAIRARHGDQVRRGPCLLQQCVGDHLCERGWYGRKTGSGWYLHGPGRGGRDPSPGAHRTRLGRAHGGTVRAELA